ncbi:hypothetical protein P3T76_014015 [Phytophthora citrophthora]|uniref:Uncharacterized protein n=1 Tax=Phytophthora citrophthora TaxID=4793 RepID=A0AAD9G1J1_9STRA|nr:hypothetical protein P3T76_014015 [Phytophthora citrophthora]
MSRKSSASARPRSSNGHSTVPRAFVEFHPSMSLENAPTLADCLAVSSDAAPTLSAQSSYMSNAEDTTLESVLVDRLHVWTKVAEVIEKLGPAEAYQGDQRETHLRTLQLTLIQEGRRSTASETLNDDTDDTDDTDAADDVPDKNEVEWNEEQQRSIDIADYDAMDLIELSEQFP